ncbi:DUF4331 domain-containing protein [Streptomyces sp. SID6648]|nr:DUF4331 domain-containing protein [Streptomyces sp. SID6648]
MTLSIQRPGLCGLNFSAQDTLAGYNVNTIAIQVPKEPAASPAH